MRLSGHNYNNDVFNSLLNGLADDVVLKNKPKTASEQGIKSTDVFTTFDMSRLNAHEQEEINKIAAELDFAAANAKVELTLDDLVNFSKTVKAEKLRGKNLERAAKQFCSKLDRAVCEPQSVVRLAQQLQGHVSDKTVLPAYYGEGGPDNSKTGKYMRSTSNPNSIWDTEALSRLASKQSDKTFGDEQIAESKAKMEAFKEKLAKAHDEQVKTASQDPNRINPFMKNVSTGQESQHNANLPKNAVSMFGNYNELDNLPEKTAGEQIKGNKEENKTQREAASKGFRTAEAKKIDNTVSNLFNSAEPDSNGKRSALDSFFEGFVKAQNKE